MFLGINTKRFYYDIERLLSIFQWGMRPYFVKRGRTLSLTQSNKNGLFGLRSWLKKILILWFVVYSHVAIAVELSGDVSLSQTGYISSELNSKGIQLYSPLSISVNGYSQGSVFEAGFAVKGMVDLSKGSSYGFLNVSEAFMGHAPVSLSSSFQSQFFFGRKLQSWSSLDEFWQLGYWQPRFMWDYLNPGSFGLTGLFWEFGSDDAGFVLFASPLYIPEMGAPVELIDGSFNSESPWFIAPPSTLMYSNQETVINYQLSIPPLKEIISKNSFVGKFRLGNKKSFWGHASYAYKPMNQMLMAYQGYLDLNEQEPEAKVVIYPRVIHHHLASFELGYRDINKSKEFLSSYLSLTAERPVDYDLEIENLTYQRISPGVTMSSVLGLNLFRLGEQSTQVQLGYLKTWGSKSFEEGANVSSKSIFDARFPYRNTFSLGVKSSFPTEFGNKFLIKTKWNYDFEYKGAIFNSSLQYSPSDSWKIAFSADILGSKSDNTNNFISRYRAYDRISGGVSYVF